MKRHVQLQPVAPPIVRRPVVAEWRTCPHCDLICDRLPDGRYACVRCHSVFTRQQIKALHRRSS